MVREKSSLFTPPALSLKLQQRQPVHRDYDKRLKSQKGSEYIAPGTMNFDHKIVQKAPLIMYHISVGLFSPSLSTKREREAFFSVNYEWRKYFYEIMCVLTGEKGEKMALYQKRVEK